MTTAPIQGGPAPAARVKKTEILTDPEVDQALARVRGGDLDAYRIVLAAYHRRLRNLVAGLCPPAVDCDEIAHLAFVQAYRCLGQYRANTDFFAWLVAIARNLLRAEYEKLQRRQRNEHNYLDHVLAQQLDSAASEPPETLMARTTFLSECRAQLNTAARGLLAQRYQDGLRVQDIASRQNRSADAVSVQLFALRKMLRDCVAGKITDAR